MSKSLKAIALIMLLSVLLVVAYYVVVVVKARDYTKDVIVKDLLVKSWRRPGGSVQPFSLKLHDLTQRQIDILLAVQDPSFESHHGIDLFTPGAGLTTITQAIAKKLFFVDFRPGIGKIKQTLIAVFALDSFLSKNDQLNLFINVMYLGGHNGKPVIGFKKAAQTYFNKDFKLLTENEYISLVAMLVAPNTFHVLRRPKRNSQRALRIKKLVSGEYKPQGLMDQYYGKLPAETIDAGLPPFSYFE